MTIPVLLSPYFPNALSLGRCCGRGPPLLSRRILRPCVYKQVIVLRARTNSLSAWRYYPPLLLLQCVKLCRCFPYDYNACFSFLAGQSISFFRQRRIHRFPSQKNLYSLFLPNVRYGPSFSTSKRFVPDTSLATQSFSIALFFRSLFAQIHDCILPSSLWRCLVS